MNMHQALGVVIHAPASSPDAITIIAQLLEFLSRHKVSTTVLLECTAAVNGAAALKRLKASITSKTAKLSLTQPLNSLAAFSASVGYLARPPSQVAVLSFSSASPGSSPAVPTAAAASGCSVLRLDPAGALPQLLSQSLFHIAAAVKRGSSATCVGYAMKPSRALALERQDMLPFLPVDGVFFLPIDPSVAILASTVDTAIVDIFLHKATDFLEEMQPGDAHATGTTTFPPAAAGNGNCTPRFQADITSLLALFRSRTTCIVDPLPALGAVLDRVRMAEALHAACTAARKMALPVRAPAWFKIDSLDPSVLKTALAQAGVGLPCVVKPQVACGVPESHYMAFVLHRSGLHSDLDVPLPAVLQEYVDHRATVWKVYMAGDAVFVAQRRSTPDLQPLVGLLADSYDEDGEEIIGGADIPPAIEFNSLDSLPVALPWLRGIAQPEDEGEEGREPEQSRCPPVMRPEFMEALAKVLQRQLGLTLFGFDVVFDFHAGEAIILDVNYFPSFKGVAEAPAALRVALVQRLRGHERKGR